MKKSVLLALFVLMPVVTAATTLVAPSMTDYASAQVTPLDDDPDDAPGLGSIVGTPDAGPDPEDAGDRGGFAQLGLAIALFLGLGFIGWRIVRESRQGRGPTDDNVPPNQHL